MTVVKSQVKAEHDVRLEKLRAERAAAQTDVTKKCKLQTSSNCLTVMALYLLLLFRSTDFVQLFKNQINVL